MSFTIVRKMPSYHYQGNDAYIKLNNTAADVYANGTLEQLSITITPGSTAVGNKIIIKAVGGDIEFKCVASLTGAAGEYLPRSSFGSDALFMDALAVQMNAHYDLHQIFFASVSSLILDLFSVAYGNYLVSPYATIVGTGYSFTHSLGAYASVLSNFRHRVEVYKTDGITNELKKLSEDRRLPNTSGDSLFNIQDYLKKTFHEYFKWIDPSMMITEVINRNPQIERFTIFLGDTGSNKGNASSFKTVPGKLRSEEFERFYRASTDAIVDTDWLNSVWNKFLTNCPSGKKVSPTGQEKLYFLARLMAMNVVVKLDAADGTTLQAGPYTNFVDMEFVEIHLDIEEILASYTTPDDIAFIKIKLVESPGTYESEEFIYEVDRSIYPKERTVIFKNQRGGYDPLRCTGDMSITSKYERVEITPMNGVGNPNTLVKRAVFNAKQNSTVNLSSGWVRKVDMLWLDDLALSDEIYLVDEKDPSIIHHAIITTTDQGRSRDRVNQYAFVFELQLLEG